VPHDEVVVVLTTDRGEELAGGRERKGLHLNLVQLQRAHDGLTLQIPHHHRRDEPHVRHLAGREDARVERVNREARDAVGVALHERDIVRIVDVLHDERRADRVDKIVAVIETRAQQAAPGLA